MTSDFKSSAFLSYEAFRQLAAHVMNLATSLHGLAPSNKAAPSMSAQYLYHAAQMLQQSSEQVKLLLSETSSRSSTHGATG